MTAGDRPGGGWAGRSLPVGCAWRADTWDEDYARALHLGKVALNPLRRVNRDRITQRSVEVPGCRRPMVAEKTEEHDAHFRDGVEYVSYRTVDEAAEAVRRARKVERKRLEREGF